MSSGFDGDDIGEQGERTGETAPDAKEVEKARERARVLAASLSRKSSRTLDRVAWVLNRFPETRDSDVELMLAYWRSFEDWNGGVVTVQQLREFTLHGPLARCRATIQNRLGLFQASLPVRSRRGILREEEREAARNAPGRSPTLTVFTDESGKTDKYLIVGGVWFSRHGDMFEVDDELREWRRRENFEKELHFKEVTESDIGLYRQAFEIVVGRSSSVSFKASKLVRTGVRNVDEALTDMFYHLAIDGVLHEHDTGRAPLPRTLTFWKDLDEPSRDQLRLANLRDRVAQAAATRFDGRLALGEFVAVDSKRADLMQVADLFVSAIGRRLNNPASPPKAKDRLADEILRLAGIPDGPDDAPVGDHVLIKAH